MCLEPQTHLSNLIFCYSPVSHLSKCIGLAFHHTWHVFTLVCSTQVVPSAGNTSTIYGSTCLSLLCPSNHLCNKGSQTTIFKTTLPSKYTCPTNFAPLYFVVFINISNFYVSYLLIRFIACLQIGMKRLQEQAFSLLWSFMQNSKTWQVRCSRCFINICWMKEWRIYYS